MDIETLKKIGGNEWQKYDYHRIYFNNLETLVGLECSYYGTGNISGATLNGERISNSRAREIESGLSGKFWYDVKAGKFQSTGMYCRSYDLHEMVVNGINAAMAMEAE